MRMTYTHLYYRWTYIANVNYCHMTCIVNSLSTRSLLLLALSWWVRWTVPSCGGPTQDMSYPPQPSSSLSMTLVEHPQHEMCPSFSVHVRMMGSALQWQNLCSSTIMGTTRSLANVPNSSSVIRVRTIPEGVCLIHAQRMQPVLWMTQSQRATRAQTARRGTTLCQTSVLVRLQHHTHVTS